MPPPLKRSLDWNQALLPAVTERLLGLATGSLIDLSRVLAIVPTRQSGRRLREALALAVRASDKGLLPPEILTPDALISRTLKAAPIASEGCMAAAWVDVLNGIDPSQFAALFPATTRKDSHGWQLGMAQRIMQLRDELGEEGLDLQTASQRASETVLEPERWRQLARLEGLYLDQLKHRDQLDPKRARQHSADRFTVPDGIERICLIATPDPQALPLKALARAAESIPVEVWPYGDPDLFDAWGRPLAEIWCQRPLDLEGWGCQLHAQATPKAVAAHVAKAAAEAQPEAILLGSADAELTPLLADELTRANIPHFDPEGHSLHRASLGQLCDLLCQLSQEASTTVVRSLFQHADLFNYIQATDSPGYLLRELDRCFETHLCADLDSLIQFSEKPRLLGALQALKQLEQTMQQAATFSQGLAAALQSTFKDLEIESGDTTRSWREQADAVRQLIAEIDEAERLFPKLGRDHARSLIRQGLRKRRLYPDRPRGAHDLLGWLELLWNDAPQLALAGLNEGKVPESVMGDPFLPETLREAFGLRTNTQRFARDAYLLEALCRRRAGDQGRIDIRVPQEATDGSPLKPSRILFLGPEATLLPRVQTLFAEPDQPNIKNAHTLPWRIRPPDGLAMPERLSVSALKSYLQCPFRFFLKHIMKMQPVDTASREMSPAAFGSLIHAVLAKLEGMAIHAETGEAEFQARLQSLAEAEVENQFGAKLSFALRLQKESLLARIQYFVTRQLEDVQLNGPATILATESKFSLSIAGLPVRGIIDRIDQRGDRQELIDYKTADSPTPPEKAHLAVVAKKDPPAHLPEAAFFEHGGKRYRWTDLQLPLYAHARMQAGECSTSRPALAYINLAKTQDKSGFARWEDFGQIHIDSAVACAEAVIRQIKAGVFWPPNPDVRPEYDDFAALFPDGIENSLQPHALEDYRFAAPVAD
jgi:ATP-dependent helicase/nuclease subunit B